MDSLDLFRDVFAAVKLCLGKADLLGTWVFVPLGIAGILGLCLAVDLLFSHVHVAFPTSVACLVLLFLGLIALEAAVGGQKVKAVVRVLDVPTGWCLRWINVFFLPAFVQLPLSPSIGIVEVLKIIAVFVIGFIVMMALAAYVTRFLQLLLGTTKRAQAQRAEELHRELLEDMPLREPTASSVDRTRATSITYAASDQPPARLAEPPQLRLQDHHTDNNNTTRSRTPDTHTAALPPPVLPPQHPPSPVRVERYAAHISRLADTITFASLFVFVGIPVYFATPVTLPLYLAISVLAYQAATRLVPASYLRFLHPVLVSSLVTVLVIWAFAAMNGVSLRPALQSYRTGTNYRALLRLRDEGADHSRPGAGDVFSSLLDASIVSLALPMFQYRRELRAHFLPIIIPNILISIASLLAYPPLCYAIGISATRSLAFASRSLTLALAMPATENLGGDTNTVAALAIISGIIGVLTGPRLLAWMRIPEDDYVTRGVTLGINSSAIATALLLRTDPRAAALSSLSMSLFGTVTVLFTSIPPVANAVRFFVDL